VIFITCAFLLQPVILGLKQTSFEEYEIGDLFQQEQKGNNVFSIIKKGAKNE
jgi:hypothetical protein